MKQPTKRADKSEETKGCGGLGSPRKDPHPICHSANRSGLLKLPVKVEQTGKSQQ